MFFVLICQVGDVDGDGFADVALVAVKEGGVRAARIYRNVPADLKASVFSCKFYKSCAFFVVKRSPYMPGNSGFSFYAEYHTAPV